ncbi:archaellin/type IV pilin N-terminal domain-containing protein [Methanococcoides burtonii]|uniref:Flagellin n=1 Tax=Methanococcoides burtonii (strain DSM 6242 / NBRC 107633 / OCM 468 / ACE-M) TaxID=259564 RepID=Q12YY5_METBU|nr:archaellin/type IV pilin N-terminal domain-containing protein [Methanococcoides burtonii]ABE51341.1 flagellin [Methanococcoides burtonii DSM 6242]
MNQWNKIIKDDKAFTGLEAAIVLVAFVVVAAVFSYVMLGAGFYTTQKSQEVVHTGVAQASSSVAVAGDVVAKGHTSDGSVANITFYISTTAGGSPVDLSKSILTYTDSDNFVANCNWSTSAIIGDSDELVEKGEKYQITAELGAGGSLVTTMPGVNEKIKIELKPPTGAVLIVERSMPPEITANSYYTVY